MIIDRNAVTQEVPIDPETGKPYINTVAAVAISPAGASPEKSTYVAQAVDVLVAARRIEFFGFGASGIVAIDAQQKFPLFGVPCVAELDSHQQVMVASMMKG